MINKLNFNIIAVVHHTSCQQIPFYLTNYIKPNHFYSDFFFTSAGHR